MNNRKVGTVCEEIVCDYLTEKRFLIVDQNYHIGKIGEIDIVAVKDKSLYIIEVKSKRSSYFGFPHEYITFRKEARLRKISKIYLKDKNVLYEDYSKYILIACVIRNKDRYSIKMYNMPI